MLKDTCVMLQNLQREQEAHMRQAETHAAHNDASLSNELQVRLQALEQQLSEQSRANKVVQHPVLAHACML